MNESSVFSDLAKETLNIIISIGSILPYVFGYIVIILPKLTPRRTVRQINKLTKIMTI
jgi:hypothetical protein